MQHFAPAPWVAAGVALIGAGAVAATPVTVPLPGLTVSHSAAVALTADFDPFGAWQDVFATAKDNAGSLWDHMSAVPGVAAQQLIADLINGTSIDPQAVFEAIVQPSMSTDELVSPLGLSNDGFHALIALVLPQMLPSDFPIPTDTLEPILSFAASPLSGVLMGALGPSIAPLVALGNSVNDISTALTGDNPDWSAALQDVVNIPANIVGGFLNGATLNLDALLPLLADQLPEGVTISSLSYTFGGLLSPGEPGTDVYGYVNEIFDGSTPGIGGSLLNGLGINLDLGFPLDVPGIGVGPLGAWLGMQEIIAGALGWDGAGSPLGDEADTIASLVSDIFSISV